MVSNKNCPVSIEITLSTDILKRKSELIIALQLCSSAKCQFALLERSLPSTKQHNFIVYL